MVQHLGTSISGELLLSPGLEEEAGREEQERDSNRSKTISVKRGSQPEATPAGG